MAAPLDITHMQQYNDIGHAVYISTCVYDATPLFIDIFCIARFSVSPSVSFLPGINGHQNNEPLHQHSMDIERAPCEVDLR